MKAYWVIGIVMAAGLRAQPQECSVDVYVEAGAPMPLGMSLSATTKATRMFREIGVKVRMRNGIPAHDPSDTCGAPMVVQFEDSTSYHGPGTALAYTRPYKQSGACIHVFIDRVLVKLNGESAFASGLLAHVMVHEITHVLEQIDRHSAEGVMKAVWSDRDYQRMKSNPLPFAPEDVDLIHLGLAARITHLGGRTITSIPGRSPYSGPSFR